MDIEQQLIAELQNKDWRLVGPDQDPQAWRSFVQAVADCIARSGNTDRLRYCITVAYSPVLFDAANGTRDHRRRERAFIELYPWIYRRLLGQYHVPENRAQALANEILAIIFGKLDQVDRPQGFFAYVAQIMFNKVREYRRQQGRLQRVDDLAGEEEEEIASMESIPDDMEFFSQIELEEAEAELLRKIHECMPKRAVRQKAVIRAIVFHGLTYHEIAQRWGSTESALYTLWHRAKHSLLTHCRGLIKEILERHRLSTLLEDRS